MISETYITNKKRLKSEIEDLNKQVESGLIESAEAAEQLLFIESKYTTNEREWH